MWIRVIVVRLWIFRFQGGTDKQDRHRSQINHFACVHARVQYVVVFGLDRETGRFLHL